MDKISKSEFKGKLNDACHAFTKGKQTEDVEECIYILEEKIEKFRQFLYKRNKFTSKEIYGFTVYDDDDLQ